MKSMYWEIKPVEKERLFLIQNSHDAGTSNTL